jgi:hypothetical protein
VGGERHVEAGRDGVLLSLSHTQEILPRYYLDR